MEVAMPKYLIQASYTPEGIKGVMKDKASGRKAAVEKAMASVGGKVESFYYSFGKHDVVVIADAPDNISAAALSTDCAASTSPGPTSALERSIASARWLALISTNSRRRAGTIKRREGCYELSRLSLFEHERLGFQDQHQARLGV